MKFSDSRTLIYGAGAAGLGIARQLRQQLELAGLGPDEQTAAVLVMDSRGIVSDRRDSLDNYKREFAWPESKVAELGLDESARKSLLEVIKAYGATALIGTSGQGGSFDEAIVRAMSQNTDQPTILPMSNPTSISEAVPADVLKWSGGKALIATGSPFEPVKLGARTQPIGQANNVFVFPGIGLGTIVSGARQITSNMISASAMALAKSLSESDIADRRLVPEVARLWEICGEVASAVALQAIEDGVCDASLTADIIESRINDTRWRPAYPEFEVSST
jgi:malate dehydrogenase (oxaloacetate-decarboxylating)